MFDESQLDHPDDLARADRAGLLRGAAQAGARVRTAARLAAEAGVDGLRPDGRPRTLLVAGPGGIPERLTDLLGALAACPVLPLAATGAAPDAHDRRWTLPGWAGPADLLLLATDNGNEPGLALLVEQAYRRGCSVTAVAPAGASLGEALPQVHGFALPFAPAPYGGTPEDADPGAYWSLLTPLLALADRLGLLAAPPTTLQAVADRLDAAAARFGPAVDTYHNPAKTLAAELADSVPLLWSTGPLTAAVARRTAALLAARTGRPALAAALPDAIPAHAGLLTPPGTDNGTGTGDDLDDFFRDRVDDADVPRPRVVLLTEPGDDSAATARVLSAARAAADAQSTPVTRPDAPPGPPLEALAELLALTEFATSYLAVTRPHA